MAFQMNYTNVRGANYPQSYWRLGWYQADRNSRQARVRFDCYFNQAARETSAETNVLEHKNYLITGDDFSAVFEAEGDVREAMYGYALSYLDGPEPEEGEPDTRVSFFAAAAVV
jgi:hypothetical protein